MAGEAIRFNASLNTAGFDSGAARLQQIAAQTSSKVSGSFAAMGARIAAVIAPFVGLYAAISSVKSALDFGGRMNDLSKTTGETAGNLAILERAFQNAGIGGEKMGLAIASMSNFITDFSNGNKAASATMDRLGISMADMAGKTPIEKMQVFMSAISGIQDPTIRTALAMDVFKKAGKEIVPLAIDFSKEIANASSELGSLPRILTENAASLDDLGDRLTNSVGNKLTELAVGLAAGATGADNFAAALSKIDAAGLGERIGDALRAAFAAPLEVLQGVGDFLISGILKAGNALVAAFKYALDVFYSLFTNPDYWSGIWQRITGGLAKIGEGFALLVVDGLQKALGALKDIPFLGEFAAKAEQSLEGVKKSIIEAGQLASMDMQEGGERIQDAWENAKNSASFLYDDILGADKYSKSASDHWQNAKAAGESLKNSSAETAKNLATGSKALTDAFNSIRGFDLTGKGGKGKPGNPMLSPNPSGKPDFFTSDNPAPIIDEASSRAASGAGRAYNSTSQELTRNQRVGQMQAEFRSRGAREQAGKLFDAGMFRSAVAAEDRANRIAERANRSAQIRDAASMFNFKGREAGNAGEALKAFGDKVGSLRLDDKLRTIPGFDPKKSDLENFKKGLLDPNWLKQQGKTPREKQDEAKRIMDEQQQKGGPSQTNPMADVGEKIDKVIKLMTERLPIRVLAA